MAKILTVGLSPAIQKTIRIPRFIPGAVNRAADYLIDASGKSTNVCRVLTQAGLEAHCLVPVGEENGELFVNLCRRDGLHVHPVPTRGRVRFCYTLIDRGAGEVTELVVNEPEAVSPEEEGLFREEYLRLLGQKPAAVTVSGSRLKGFSDDIIPFLVKAAVDRGVVFLADYKGEDLKNSFLSQTIHPDLVKVNRDELLQTFPGIAASEEALKELARQYRCAFVVTHGAEPTLYADESVSGTLESRMVKAVNPIGCGDSFMAGLAEAAVAGLPLAAAVEKGRHYAALNAVSYHPGWIKEDEEP